MALTLHFQRGAQSLQTGDGVGLGSQGPLPGLLGDPAAYPLFPTCWVLSGSRCLLWASRKRAFGSEAGECYRF